MKRRALMFIGAALLATGAARAQVAPSQPGVLDDDGVGQALLALPLLDDQRHPA